MGDPHSDKSSGKSAKVHFSCLSPIIAEQSQKTLMTLSIMNGMMTTGTTTTATAATTTTNEGEYKRRTNELHWKKKQIYYIKTI